MRQNNEHFFDTNKFNNMRYIALIQKRGEYGNRHFVFSDGETKERFIERMINCYIKNARNEWELEIYELGEPIYP